MLKKSISLILIIAFLMQAILSPAYGQSLPITYNLTPRTFDLPVLRYLSVNTANPSNYFNFLLDKGSRLEVLGSRKGQEPNTYNLAPNDLNSEATKLISYFFLGLTLSGDAFWVNLKPQEPDRITSSELSQTDLGRTLLEQDLRLKKDMSQYLNPQNPTGKLFWESLYAEIEKQIGKDKLKKTTITTSNRVWIVPDKVVVLETEDGALISEAKLKVLLESEYLSLSRKTEKLKNRKTEELKNEEEQIRIISESLMKEIVIPAITKDVNESQSYAPLRQIYHSLILAQWFKHKHKNDTSTYAQAINKGYLKGLESQVPWEKQQIWQDYLKSYQEGEYKFIDKAIFNLKRMYFSGGIIIPELFNLVPNAQDGSSPIVEVKSFYNREGGPITPVDEINDGNKVLAFYKDTGATSLGANRFTGEVEVVSPEAREVSGSPVMLEYFKKKLAALELIIDGLDRVSPYYIASEQLGATQWYLFEMPNDRYLELFIKGNDISGYGIASIVQQNLILRFQSFEKNAGNANEWAKVYQDRINKIREIMRQRNKDIKAIGVPTDQVISEAQLAKRIRAYWLAKFPASGSPEENIYKFSASIIQKVRHGDSLNEDELRMIEYKDFDGYHSFGPAADFYINKLKFDLVATIAAPHKYQLTGEETILLNKLRSGGYLSETEVISLFSGRGLIQGNASSPIDENLPAISDKILSYASAEDFLEKVKGFVRAKGDIFYKERFLGILGMAGGSGHASARETLDKIQYVLENEIRKLIQQGELILTDFDPNELKEGDVVIRDDKDIAVYKGKSFMGAYLGPGPAPDMPPTYLFDRLDSSYFGETITEEGRQYYKIIRPASTITIDTVKNNEFKQPPVSLKDRFANLLLGTQALFSWGFDLNDQQGFEWTDVQKYIKATENTIGWNEVLNTKLLWQLVAPMMILLSEQYKPIPLSSVYSIDNTQLVASWWQRFRSPERKAYEKHLKITEDAYKSIEGEPVRSAVIHSALRGAVEELRSEHPELGIDSERQLVDRLISLGVRMTGTLGLEFEAEESAASPVTAISYDGESQNAGGAKIIRVPDSVLKGEKQFVVLQTKERAEIPVIQVYFEDTAIKVSGVGEQASVIKPSGNRSWVYADALAILYRTEGNTSSLIFNRVFPLGQFKITIESRSAGSPAVEEDKSARTERSRSASSAVEKLRQNLMRAGLLNHEGGHLYDISDPRTVELYQQALREALPQADPRDTTSWKQITALVGEHLKRNPGPALIVLSGAARHFWGALPDLERLYNAAYISTANTKLSLPVLKIKEGDDEAETILFGQLKRDVNVMKYLGYDSFEAFIHEREAKLPKAEHAIVGLEETGIHGSLYFDEGEGAYKYLAEFLQEFRPASVLFIGEDLNVDGMRQDYRKETGIYPARDNFLLQAKRMGIMVNFAAFGETAGSPVEESVSTEQTSGSEARRRASSAVEGGTGGIDLSQIELTLKDDKYISSLNPADIKILRAARALNQGWSSLSLLYVHEVILLLKYNLIHDLTQRQAAIQVMRQLKLNQALDPQAARFCSILQSNIPIPKIKPSFLK